MQDHTRSSQLPALVHSPAELELFLVEMLPTLLDRTTAQTRRFLRETNQWSDDIEHEKLALRWGYELVERFLANQPAEFPYRPTLLLDSFIAGFLSQSDPFCYHRDLCTSLGRFIDGLFSRAVISRDALTALFHHLYGFGPTQVIQLLGVGAEDNQRIYKNFERWRRTGWQRSMAEIGIGDEDLFDLEERLRRAPISINKEADHLVGLLEAHYRKSEPDHSHCRSRQEWEELFLEDYGHDYRLWHLALCRGCLGVVYSFRHRPAVQTEPLQIALRLRPWQRRSLVETVAARGHNGTPQRARRLSAAAH
jgi:hypothetical protein